MKTVENVTYTALKVMNYQKKELRDTLLQMALFSSPSMATNALLHSIFAFSLVHKNSRDSRAIEHQAAAVKALQMSAQSQPSYTELCQHVAAGMLLGSFEVCTT